MGPSADNIGFKNEHSLIKLIESQHKVCKYNNADSNDVGKQDTTDVSAGDNLLANSNIQLNDIAVKVKQNDKHLYPNNAVVKEIVLEGSKCEQVNEVGKLEQQVRSIDEFEANKNYDKYSHYRDNEQKITFFPIFRINF